MPYELYVLFVYLTFVAFTIFAVNQIPHYTRVEEVVPKITYNLREQPRVDYKELSSEEEESSENLSEEDSPYEESTEFHRRDRIAFSRIVSETLG